MVEILGHKQVAMAKRTPTGDVPRFNRTDYEPLLYRPLSLYGNLCFARSLAPTKLESSSVRVGELANE